MDNITISADKYAEIHQRLWFLEGVLVALEDVPDEELREQIRKSAQLYREIREN